MIIDRTSLDNDGASVSYQGSSKNPYVLKNTQGVISCSCPAWRNQSAPISSRTCKHIIAVRGVDAENARVGNPGGGLGTSITKKILTVAKEPNEDWAMLAESYAFTDKVVGWYWSEKLDGVRLRWDPFLKCFVTRAGNPVKPPTWFVEDFPNIHLDGELWMGRGKFQEASSLARSADGGDRWNNAFFMVFDWVEPKLKWEERLEALVERANKAKLEPHGGVRRLAKKAFLLPQTLVTENTNVGLVLESVTTKGGEGIMLRKPGSLYVPRRSPALLKFKRFHTDEAEILGVLEGTGRLTGTMGALKVRNRQGAEFAVGSGFTDAMRRTWWSNRDSLHMMTSILEYQYQEKDPISSVPRFPTFKRVRTDLTSL